MVCLSSPQLSEQQVASHVGYTAGPLGRKTLSCSTLHHESLLPCDDQVDHIDMIHLAHPHIVLRWDNRLRRKQELKKLKIFIKNFMG